MYCPRCGTRMEGGICPECGFPVNRARKKKTGILGRNILFAERFEIL